MVGMARATERKESMNNYNPTEVEQIVPQASRLQSLFICNCSRFLFFIRPEGPKERIAGGVSPRKNCDNQLK